MSVVLRWFGGAAEASGVEEERYEPGPLSGVQGPAQERHGPSVTQVLPRCSVLVDGRNAAVRVTFSPEAPTRWRPASIPGGGHVFGVDAGSACLVDYPAYAAQTRRDKAAMWRRFTEAEDPGAIEAPLPEGNRGIVVASGIGDGAYPVYWGIAADGAVAQLVVDFLMLVKTGEDGVMRHL